MKRHRQVPINTMGVVPSHNVRWFQRGADPNVSKLNRGTFLGTDLMLFSNLARQPEAGDLLGAVEAPFGVLQTIGPGLSRM